MSKLGKRLIHAARHVRGEVYIGPTEWFVAAFDRRQADAHVKAWRWEQHMAHTCFATHIRDYYLWKEMHK